MWFATTPSEAEGAALVLFVHALRFLQPSRAYCSQASDIGLGASAGSAEEQHHQAMRRFCAAQFVAVLQRAQACARRLRATSKGTLNAPLAPSAALLIWQAGLARGAAGAAQKLLVSDVGEARPPTLASGEDRHMINARRACEKGAQWLLALFAPGDEPNQSDLNRVEAATELLLKEATA